MNLDRMRNVSGNFVRARSFVRELLLVCKRGIMFVENDEYIFNDGFFIIFVPLFRYCILLNEIL